MPRQATDADKSSASIGFEAKLWLAADKLRNSFALEEYKRAVPKTYLPQVHR